MIREPLFLVSAYLFAAVLLRMLRPNLATGVLLAIVLIASTGYLGAEYGDHLLAAAYRGRDAVLTLAGRPPGWPPEINRTYPDLELIDQEGNPTRLSEFRGRVILIEPVGMPCRACVALAGGHERGAFEGIQPQANLGSIEGYARRFGRIRLDDDRIVYVHLLLFNRQMKAPTLQEGRAWAAHFGMERSENQIVLAGTPGMASNASRAIIPGFHLVDKHFVLRADSTGHPPKHDLYTELLPMVRKLLKE